MCTPSAWLTVTGRVRLGFLITSILSLCMLTMLLLPPALRGLTDAGASAALPVPVAPSARSAARQELGAAPLAALDALPLSVPPSCAAHYRFWTPHIEHFLRFNRARSVKVTDVVNIPYSNVTFGMVFQILGGELYFRPFPAPQTPGRMPALIWEMARVVRNLSSMLLQERGRVTLPDIIFRSSADDEAQLQVAGDALSHVAYDVQAPMLCTCANAQNNACTPAPDWTTGWWDANGVDEEQGMDYDQFMRELIDRARQRPYASRVDKAVTRGDMRHPDRQVGLKAFIELAPELVDAGVNTTELDMELVRMVANGASAAEVADARRAALRSMLLAATNMGAPLQCRDLSMFKVQLYMSGNGYSARLKYLLATGSPVVYLTTTRRGNLMEYFTPALVPWVHYIPVYSGPILVQTVQWLLARPDEAQRIGAAGQAFVQEYLMRPALVCWWASLFALYAQRLADGQSEVAHRMPLSVHLDAPAPGEGNNRPLRMAVGLVYETALGVMQEAVAPVLAAARPDDAVASEADYAAVAALPSIMRLRKAVAAVGVGDPMLNDLLSRRSLLRALGKLEPMIHRRPACDDVGNSYIHVPWSWLALSGQNATQLAFASAGDDVQLLAGARVVAWLATCRQQ